MASGVSGVGESRFGGVTGLLLLACAATLPAWPAGAADALFPPKLSDANQATYRTAFASIAAGRWSDALSAANAGTEPLLSKTITWAFLADSRSRARFLELAAFIDANPDWPQAETLLRNAENALGNERNDDAVLDWFTRHPPLTGAGMVRFAEALTESGRPQDAITWARKAWTDTSLTKENETRLLAGFGKLLSKDDHARRLDALLWLNKTAEARRMLPRVVPEQRQLAEARMALRSHAPGVDGMVAKLPDNLKSDPGLLYERIRWRRQANNTNGALELLLTATNGTGPESVWWTERAILGRRALAAGRVDDAYKIFAGHGTNDPVVLSEGEWLAGWVALRYRNDAATAYQHFTREYDAVRTPVSVSRAAYWAGMAAAALDQATVADTWFQDAARFATTFYGQMALDRMGSARIAIAADPQPNAADVDALGRRELARVAVMLAEVGEQDRLRPFLLKLTDSATTPGQAYLVAELAGAVGRTDLGVAVAKRSLQRDGVQLAKAGYPRFPVAGTGAEQALVLAITRQESEFNEKAVSSAGARGLMQLMPATAKLVAAAQNVKYDGTQLFDDAYNLRLGIAHLSSLLDQYNGSYVLAIAAYNAGEGRVREWLKDNGDPRAGAIDVVDWIEAIPISETRNYVQRVVENLEVYRSVLTGTATAVTITKDLRR